MKNFTFFMGWVTVFLFEIISPPASQKSLPTLSLSKRILSDSSIYKSSFTYENIIYRITIEDNDDLTKVTVCPIKNDGKADTHNCSSDFFSPATKKKGFQKCFGKALNKVLNVKKEDEKNAYTTQPTSNELYENWRVTPKKK